MADSPRAPVVRAVGRALPKHYADQETLIAAFRDAWAGSVVVHEPTGWHRRRQQAPVHDRAYGVVVLCIAIHRMAERVRLGRCPEIGVHEPVPEQGREEQASRKEDQARRGQAERQHAGRRKAAWSWT